MACLRGAESSLALLLALAALPFLTDDFVAYQIGLFLIYGMVAQGVALCWGRLGFLPLGHALFFGLAAYLFGAVLRAAEAQPPHLQPLYWLALPLAIVLPALLAGLMARLVFARSSTGRTPSGPFFSLITLALTILGFLVAQQASSLTGGFNGMTGIPDLPGTERYETLYWVIALCAVLSTLVLSVLDRRPIGILWRAIAQNEARLQLLGFATAHTKANAFACSALLASVAGALFAAHQGIVTPQAMSFVLSTEFVIWAAVGGKGSALGPLLGAVLIGFTSAQLREQYLYWEVFIAVLFIATVLWLPHGVTGGVTAGFRLLKRKFTAGTRAAPDRPLAAQFLRPAPPARQASCGALTLQLKNVCVAQGGVTILDGLTLSLQGAGIRCIIGPNGAGKTSLFNAITGHLPPKSGQMKLNGQVLDGLRTWQIMRLGLGRKMQIPSVFAGLTVRENLCLALWSGRMGARAALTRTPLAWHSPLLDQLLQHFPPLQAQQHAPAGTLAQGHRQALELAMTLLPEPRLILLDEPCAGLSPAETQHMIDVINTLVEQMGAAALLIEHDISAVAAIGGKVYVLHQGRVLDHGPLPRIQNNPAVRAVYAGGRK